MEINKKIPTGDIRTIFFDYDGTLHDSLKIYSLAFKKAYVYLVNEGLAEDKEWSDKEISYWLGYNAKEMWKSFRPDLSSELQQYCSNIIGSEMKELIEQGKPVLYEGAFDVLSYLKNTGFHLIFISNCNVYYMESHKKLFQLDRYFDTFLCSEEYNYNPKSEIISNIKNLYPEKMVIVGDRKQDMDAGVKNGIYTIGCRFGYARATELEEADILIDDIRELTGIF
ncbi:HAD-IA family hydrolase [Anaerocolumna sedimenticola]|uniref:HAD-IA family hydrolase n=1 Tax=Anaerocolumna sedimenticola TaxID=2696063 RepID=A0A6P1TM85_9FIRM|nr:HAD-IA family hydrolase [Anaerocolumna sedimenticola]QHQ60966.1 HAD-IA family hydrolase [Anaerocolumna sedimenticola]